MGSGRASEPLIGEPKSAQARKDGILTCLLTSSTSPKPGAQAKPLQPLLAPRLAPGKAAFCPSSVPSTPFTRQWQRATSKSKVSLVPPGSVASVASHCPPDKVSAPDPSLLSAPGPSYAHMLHSNPGSSSTCLSTCALHPASTPFMWPVRLCEHTHYPGEKW
jgi:hypothetical protein